MGEHLADDLERIVALHDASTIAAVIVEPMAGSTGVLPAPKGYLRRLRAICDKYGILLILDEVITGFGRLGYAFAAERYGIVPDIMTFAKGITSGTVPMGGVIVRKGIYDAFMRGPEHVVELFHGYTYSAHPLACAAGLATLTSTVTSACSSARERSSRFGPTPQWGSKDCQTCSISAASVLPPASTWPRDPTRWAGVPTKRWSTLSPNRIW